MIPVTRPVHGSGRTWLTTLAVYSSISHHRPLSGGAPYITGPLPVTAPGNMPYAGMDPSDPATYVRPWNPQPGMVGRLNYDGSQAQAVTPTGGVQRGRHQRRYGYR